MIANRQIRLVLALLIVTVLLLAVAAVLFITESALSVRAQLEEISPWAFYGFFGVVLVLAAAGGWSAWRLLIPNASGTKNTETSLPTEEEVDTRLEKALESGIDVSAAVRELKELHERRSAGEIYIAVYGDISAGKSSLIQALMPGADLKVAATGGTTRTIDRYVWSSPAGDHLNLVDMPGTNEPERLLDAIAREEALRAHVVIYVCEGDLTRTQFQELQALLALHKPLVVAVNKTDRFSESDLKLIISRLRQRLSAWPSVEIVPIQAGGIRQVVRLLPDGKEQLVEQTMPPQVKPLQGVLQQIIDSDAKMIESLRDAAVFVLASQKLDDAVASQRRQRANEIVRQYTRKAVVGALAAVSPGTDIIIQGYLAVSLIKELCALYETPARQLDAERFLQLAEAQTGKALPLMLALAGNTLKAFPGIGTVAGGLAHAVAYGLIFDALGSAVSRTLESRGTLLPEAAMKLFKESLGGDLEARARRMVELATSARREQQHES